jgi:hypothetical protein
VVGGQKKVGGWWSKKMVGGWWFKKVVGSQKKMVGGFKVGGITCLL